MSFFDVMYEPPLSRDEEYPLPRRVQKRLMDWDMFTGLISELAEWNFDGVLSMFLLNLRLDAEVECARRAASRVHLRIDQQRPRHCREDRRASPRPRRARGRAPQAGLAEERLAVTAPRLHCNRPMRHAVVTWDGRFLLCCALDPLDPDAVVVGSIDYDRMHEYRLHLQERRRDLPGCDHCDAHVFRRVR